MRDRRGGEERATRETDVHQDTRVSTAVEGDTKTSESLLPCGVPDLHGHLLVLYHHRLGQKVSSDRSFVRLRKLVVHILVEKRGLSDAVCCCVVGGRVISSEEGRFDRRRRELDAGSRARRCETENGGSDRTRYRPI